MVATFILTRAFAISAMLVGAISSAYAAPVPTTLKPREMLTNYIAEPADSNVLGDAAPIGHVDTAQPDIDLVTDMIPSLLSYSPAEGFAHGRIPTSPSFVSLSFMDHSRFVVQ
ncbi:uncharacterized protein LAESUDRAFT_717451 [Laetiporus sulphureus 93-53]|uniref:Uncharacterized protein n=1 Tax=Laetiporus sulphureus 93-53 TaxID=1314785 RepID=A0A165BPT7_9APHY|nr:uncharacterized protein LAESUDRAFT_717451 [Laetiporus sulphureus 93-53]KZT01436.1 hypothetical protein LAESUDRAFT_717451 [Laetiporus sulphureus 93-53]